MISKKQKLYQTQEGKKTMEHNEIVAYSSSANLVPKTIAMSTAVATSNPKQPNDRTAYRPRKNNKNYPWRINRFQTKASQKLITKPINVKQQPLSHRLEPT
jgi:hypothetical protein